MNREYREASRPRVIFTYSFYLLLIIDLILLAVFVPILIGYVLTASLGASLVFSALDLILIGSVFRIYSSPVHHAWFFEDHFEVQGLKLNKSIGYDRVKEIQRTKAALLSPSRVQIRIIARGEDPLVIPGNLRNPRLQTDLYSWLSKRIHETTPPNTSP